MKQLILISRIHAYREEEEFTKYSIDNTIEFLHTIYTEGYTLLIVNGSKIRPLSPNSQKAKKILDIALTQKLDKANDTVIAYHNTNDLNTAINNAFLNDGWVIKNVKTYSSARETDIPLYEILDPLGKEIKQGQPSATLLKELWDFFGIDTLLEAKLNLLHDIANGKSITALPEILHTPEVVQCFEPLKGGKYDNNDEDLRENLKKLRDSVLKIR